MIVFFYYLFWCHKITVIVLRTILAIIFQYIKSTYTSNVSVPICEGKTKENYYDYTFCHIFYCIARAAADNDDDHHHVIVIFQYMCQCVRIVSTYFLRLSAVYLG